MSRTIASILIALVLLIAGAAIAPSFIDWNKYKGQIVQQVEAASGYKAEIAGDLKIGLLPAPHVRMTDVKVAAPLRGQHDYLATLESAEASVALLPLLKGQVQVDSVRLEKPDVRFEVLADGRKSWMTEKLSEPGQIGSGPSENRQVQSISLRKVEIGGGRFEYSDRRKVSSTVLEQVDATLKARSLKGPFEVEGRVVYGANPLAFTVKTGLVESADDPLEIQVTLAHAELKAALAFFGVAAMQPALEVQGELQLTADNLGSLAAMGVGVPASLQKKVQAKGLVTVSENSAAVDNLELALGDLKASGKIGVSNIKAADPMRVAGALDVKGEIDFDELSADKPEKDASKDMGKKIEPEGFLPDTLVLPASMDGALTLNAEAIKMGGQEAKGLLLDIAKDGSNIAIKGKALEIPGKGRASIDARLAYASSSRSGPSVTYVDPKLTFHATGRAEQFPTLLRALAPKGDNSAYELYRTASFDLTGDIIGPRISLRESVLKLDGTTLGIGGSYRPGKPRPAISLDLVADSLDVDMILARLENEKKNPVQPSEKTAEEKIETVRNFSLPVDADFDISAQKVRYKGMDVAGVRMKGRSAGKTLQLDSASVNDYAGAALSAKGQIEDLETLSGVDLTLYGKTRDLRKLAAALEMDASAIPEGLNSAEATVTVKGKAEDLNFTGDINAMNGQMNATGKVTDVLKTPKFGNLEVGMKHPNLAALLRTFKPEISLGDGMAKPFDFYTQALREADIYTLSGLKANLGPTGISGDLKMDLGSARPAVTGKLRLSNVPLDSFMGAEARIKSAGTSRNAAEPSGGKWSRNAMDTAWMRSVDFDFDVMANSITHGGWRFVEPTLKASLRDGDLEITNFQSGLFGGTVSFNGLVQSPSDPKAPITASIQSTLTKVGIEALARAMSGSNTLKGQGEVSMSMDIKTAGISPLALVSGLGGQAALDGVGVVLEGFDLAKLAQSLSADEKIGHSIENLVDASVKGGQTRFDTVKGRYDVSEGVVRISSMALDGPDALVNVTGNANLPQWTIDIMNEITLKRVTDLTPFKVAIRGPLDNPGNTFGRAILQDYINRKIQRKINKELENVLGDRLKDLGLDPQQQPAGGQPSQQPAQQQQQITPEKAIQGVLQELLKQ